MDVIVFSVARDPLCFEVVADFVKDISQVLYREIREHFTAESGDKDQVNVSSKNAMSTGAILVCDIHCRMR